MIDITESCALCILLAVYMSVEVDSSVVFQYMLKAVMVSDNCTYDHLVSCDYLLN
ncbi:hypothetical protein M758_2G041900 [Ceratodon purpureus]|nr:hypothetical protein M758_2G041900 [Ceratodon purpureus]